MNDDKRLEPEAFLDLVPQHQRGRLKIYIGAAAILTRNLFIYGFGGVIIPFIGIKAIDIMIAALHLA